MGSTNACSCRCRGPRRSLRRKRNPGGVSPPRSRRYGVGAHRRARRAPSVRLAGTGVMALADAHTLRRTSSVHAEPDRILNLAKQVRLGRLPEEKVQRYAKARGPWAAKARSTADRDCDLGLERMPRARVDRLHLAPERIGAVAEGVHGSTLHRGSDQWDGRFRAYPVLAHVTLARFTIAAHGGAPPVLSHRSLPCVG